MKDEVINRLVAVLNALDNVSVRGKPNLANLSGSIAILEETRDILRLRRKRNSQKISKRRCSYGFLGRLFYF